MNDQIPADKVREVRDLHRDAAKMVTITDAEREIHQHVADAMEALLPHPDLPRMEWPGDTPTGSNTLAVGAVIESADDPRLSALPVGSMLIDRDGGVFDVTKNYTGEWAGPGYVPAQGTGTKWGPWTVRRIGLGADQ